MIECFWVRSKACIQIFDDTNKISEVNLDDKQIHRSELTSQNKDIISLLSDSKRSSYFHVRRIEEQKDELLTLKEKIQGFQPYDNYGNLFTCFDYENGYLYDRREGTLNKLFDIEKYQRHFNLIYSNFNQERVVSYITGEKVLTFDIRNTGECIYKLNHHCMTPPTEIVGINKESHNFIKKLSKIEDFQEFQSIFDSRFSQESNKNIYKDWTGVGLFSPRKKGSAIYMEEFRIKDKEKLKNTFYYEILKELNVTIDKDCLFQGLFQSKHRPLRLYSSNLSNPNNRIVGLNLVQVRDKLQCFCLDDEDTLTMQIIEKERTLKKDERGEGEEYRLVYKRLETDPKIEKELHIKKNNFLKKPNKISKIVLHNNSQEIASQSEDNQMPSHKESDEDTGQSKNSENSEESEEEGIVVNDSYEYKNLVDLRELAETLIEESKEEDASVYKQSYQEVDNKITPNIIKNDNDAVKVSEEVQEISNDEFYLSNNILAHLKNSWT